MYFWHCDYHVYLQLLVWVVEAFLICNCNIPLWIKMVTKTPEKKTLNYQENIFTAWLRTEVIKTKIPVFFITGQTCCLGFFFSWPETDIWKFNLIAVTLHKQKKICHQNKKYQPLHGNCFPISYLSLTKIPLSQPGVHPLNSPQSGWLIDNNFLSNSLLELVSHNTSFLFLFFFQKLEALLCFTDTRHWYSD